MYRKVIGVFVAVIFMCSNVFAMCGSCGMGEEGHGQGEMGHVFSSVAKDAAMKYGVREISYDQFMKIKNSSDKYKLLDVLSSDSYNKGHIDGALSFPVNEINKATAGSRLSKSDDIIVYCGSFQCSASTEAAKKLSALGYNVLDYKGGLKEWQEKGNQLVK